MQQSEQPKVLDNFDSLQQKVKRREPQQWALQEIGSANIESLKTSPTRSQTKALVRYEARLAYQVGIPQKLQEEGEIGIASQPYSYRFQKTPKYKKMFGNNLKY